ncbi:hypothetical protein MANES_12G086416v8 [Manihot esculenta]|uniref:Uncharacterized protein n=1 Tax=Manihot esculenta TaxID=3983 RepID=A0ACB7GQX8_MANES|nr:hypothetical protein MANES_12G086416v8 [Manihot esculenta]
MRHHRRVMGLRIAVTPSAASPSAIAHHVCEAAAYLDGGHRLARGSRTETFSAFSTVRQASSSRHRSRQHCFDNQSSSAEHASAVRPIACSPVAIAVDGWL